MRSSQINFIEYGYNIFSIKSVSSEDNTDYLLFYSSDTF